MSTGYNFYYMTTSGLTLFGEKKNLTLNGSINYEILVFIKNNKTSQNSNSSITLNPKQVLIYEANWIFLLKVINPANIIEK